MNPISGFFSLNRRLSFALVDRLPQSFTRHLHTIYKYQVAEALNRRPGQVAIDIGGGRECPFLPFVTDPRSHLVIALDASAGELQYNRQLSAKIVADAARPGFPVRDGSVDLVVSRSLVEHLPDNSAYFANCARALRPAGIMIHAFPCRFAPFALLNQVLPNRVVRRLIALFFPHWAEKGSSGFVAYYDRCCFSSVRRLLRANGLTNESYIFTYYQSLYFTSLFPLFCVMVSYDLLVWALRIRNLASGMLVMAERPAESPVAEARTRRDSVLVGGDVGG